MSALKYTHPGSFHTCLLLGKPQSISSQGSNSSHELQQATDLDDLALFSIHVGT